jgi:hypothetical protein
MCWIKGAIVDQENVAVQVAPSQPYRTPRHSPHPFAPTSGSSVARAAAKVEHAHALANAGSFEQQSRRGSQHLSLVIEPFELRRIAAQRYWLSVVVIGASYSRCEK